MSNAVKVNSSSVLQRWSVDFTPLDRGEIQQRARQLEDRLLSRLSISVLSQRGIVDDSDLAASLHSAASNLNRQLARRSSVIELQNKNILPMEADDHARSQYVDAKYHQRKQSLKNAMLERKDISEIADLGYIDDSGMAPALQPTALRLNRRLTERKSRKDLELKGIIFPENETAPDDEEPHEAQQSKPKNRKSRSQKHEKTPSVIWRDVKRRKSKKTAQSGSDHDGTVSSGGQYRVGDLVKLTKGRSGTIRLSVSVSTVHRKRLCNPLLFPLFADISENHIL